MMVTAPVGVVVPYAGDIDDPDLRAYFAGVGWLVCDGSRVDTECFAELFFVLGDRYGSVEASDTGYTFQLPDYRGQFLRGLDTRPASESRDPDAEHRGYADPASKTGNSGAKVGSTQDFAFQGHEHGVTQATGAQEVAEGGTGGFGAETSGETTSIETVGEYGEVKVAKETRPTNAAVNFLIKCRSDTLAGWPEMLPAPI